LIVELRVLEVSTTLPRLSRGEYYSWYRGITRVFFLVVWDALPRLSGRKCASRGTGALRASIVSSFLLCRTRYLACPGGSVPPAEQGHYARPLYLLSCCLGRATPPVREEVCLPLNRGITRVSVVFSSLDDVPRRGSCVLIHRQPEFFLLSAVPPSQYAPLWCSRYPTMRREHHVHGMFPR